MNESSDKVRVTRNENSDEVSRSGFQGTKVVIR